MRLQRFLEDRRLGHQPAGELYGQNYFMTYVAANLLALRGLAGFDAVP